MADAKPLNEEELRKVLDFLWHLNSEETNKVIATIAARDTTIQQQATTIEGMRGALKPFTKLECTAIASISGELRITFNTPMAKGMSIKVWNDKLEQARQFDTKEEK